MSALHGIRSSVFSYNRQLCSHTGSVWSKDGDLALPLARVITWWLREAVLCLSRKQTGLLLGTCLTRLQVTVTGVWLCVLLQFWLSVTQTDRANSNGAYLEQVRQQFCNTSLWLMIDYQIRWLKMAPNNSLVLGVSYSPGLSFTRMSVPRCTPHFSQDVNFLHRVYSKTTMLLKTVTLYNSWDRQVLPRPASSGFFIFFLLCQNTATVSVACLLVTCLLFFLCYFFVLQTFDFLS